MTRLEPPALLTLKRVQETLGLSRTVIRGLIDAGFVSPQRANGGQHRFSFQDLMLLRTAHALQQASMPPRRILSALAKLRRSLPAALPLTGLRISAVGNEIVVRDRLGTREVDSGQWLMDFEVAPRGAAVVFMRAAGAAPDVAPEQPPESGADAWFSRGEAEEAAEIDNPAAAEASYRRALEIDPGHLAATLNLGALWCESGRCDEAAALYEAALVRGATSPLLHFNHAIALEDRQLPAQALASYERSIALDPKLADAHFNAGRLHELLGDPRQALRHFSAYKRLQRSDRGNEGS